MSALDPRIEAIRAEYGLARDDFWELPQKKGTWLVKHSALETVSVKAKITFDMPEIIQANAEAGVAVITVRGFKGDRSEWSFGECNPKNNKNAYPFSMAEKRGKDRVILKLAGLHGLVYSEDEMSEPTPNIAATVGENVKRQIGFRTDGSKTSYALKNVSADDPNSYASFIRELGDCETVFATDKLAFQWSKTIEAEKWNEPFKEQAREAIRQHKQHIINTQSTIEAG